MEGPLLALGWTNTIVFNLSIGYLMAVFFWWLVVYLPEKNRRRLLRDSLSRQYQYFKERVLQTLLWAAVGGYDSNLPKELLDHKNFKTYFNENEKSRWYAALNGIQGNAECMKELTLYLKTMADEVAYTLNNVAVQETNVHDLLKNLNESLLRLNQPDEAGYDQVKYLGGFLWAILAQWSFIDGYQTKDVIQNAIDRL